MQRNRRRYSLPTYVCTYASVASFEDSFVGLLKLHIRICPSRFVPSVSPAPASLSLSARHACNDGRIIHPLPSFTHPSIMDCIDRPLG